MTYSLFILTAALLFTAFGYVALLRILYKLHFDGSEFSIRDLLNQPHSARHLLDDLFHHLGQGIVVLSLPTIGLMLFWGWGAAVLWLIGFHILVQSPINFFQSSTQNYFSINYFSTQEGSLMTSILIPSVWRVYLCLLIAVTITLLAELIDQQSGLIFALLALIPAHSILRSKSSAMPDLVRTLLTLLAFAIGLLFADQLGISIYGSIEPFASANSDSWLSGLSWLKLDNSTLIAAGLLLASASMATRLSFRHDLAKLIGLVLVIGLVTLMINFLLLNPTVDAPMNISPDLGEGESGLPAFMGLSLFIFAGLSMLLLHSNSPSSKREGATSEKQHFAILQTTSLIQLIFVLLITLALAAAIGIGAWKTHYLDWAANNSLDQQFTLALSSAFGILNSAAGPGSMPYSLFISAMGLTAFALALHLLAKLQNLNTEQESGHAMLKVWKNQTLMNILIFALACYLVDRGISLHFWLIPGMLAWLLVCSALSHHASKAQENHPANLAQAGICLGLIGLGTIQVAYIAISSLLQSQFAIGLFAAIVLIVGFLIWGNKIVPLVKRFQTLEPANPFQAKAEEVSTE